jgi:hypothetical protein
MMCPLTACEQGMKTYRVAGATFLTIVAIAIGIGVSSAQALAAAPTPAWSVQSVAQPTSFSATDNGSLRCSVSILPYSQCDRYTIVFTNVGARASSGPIIVRDRLPAGMTISHPPGGDNELTGFKWECATEEVAGREIATCSTESSVPALTAATAIEIPVSIGSVSGSPVNEVEVSGGEANAPAGVSVPTSVDEPPLSFAPLDFELSLLDSAGILDMQAATHPGVITTSFLFPSANLLEESKVRPYPVEDVKDIVTDLPAGLIGDALAAPTCSLSDVTNLTLEETQCPSSTRVGKLVFIDSEAAYTELTIFNVTPEHGHPAEFAVYLPNLSRAVLLYATLVGSGADAHVRVTAALQPRVLRAVGISLTFFGNPTMIDNSPTTPTAFATGPSNCAAAGFTSTVYVDSWQRPGRVEADGQPDLSDPSWRSASSISPPVTGCEALQFHPSLSFAPEAAHSQADEPSGYSSTLQVPQNENQNGLATPPLKNTVVTLPAGVAISPAAADGLVGCQASGGEGIELESSDPGHCPAASKVGEVEAVTSVLKEPLSGGVYVAQPGCSPCSEAQAEDGEVFALYLELGSESAGVHVKVKGRVEVGGSGQHSREAGLQPGQIRTTFAETPQQPVGELKLKFNGGPRAPLANPQSCGSLSSVGELEPWSHQPAPGEAQGTPNVTLNPSFTVSGCQGGFNPGFVAGTTNPQAGGFSPFTLTFSRQDREQDLSGVTVNMPQGLLGRIAGIAQCAEAQANAGSCPAASQVGSATAAAGSGSHPFWQSGQVFLTGPYKGAPFGLSVVVPAVAGPFNLGDIVVRAAIYIDPHTAQVTVVSDPLPQSVDGVPLRVKTVNVTVGAQADFTFNPTSCSPLAVSGLLTSVQGVQAAVASRFQAANCQGLPFKPSFSVSTAGRTSKAKGASLVVRVAAKPGEANVRKVAVQLPLALPARLTTLQKACTEAQFNANPAGCPAASDVGTVTVHTPLLNAPLVGPAYFVSHGGAAFPDLDLVLQGEGVTIELVGNTLIKKGITYSRFESVPDAPFSSFELNAPQGPDSILAANTNLCAPTKTVTVRKRVTVRSRGRVRHVTRSVTQRVAEPLVIPTTLTGQNGAVVSQSTKVAVTGCPKAKHKAKKTTKKKTKKKATERGKSGGKGNG